MSQRAPYLLRVTGDDATFVIRPGAPAGQWARRVGAWPTAIAARWQTERIRERLRDARAEVERAQAENQAETERDPVPVSASRGQS